ncbi:terpene synthase family protein [Streptomyces aidingensis]|uniref:Uncharacterized protein n=1 Tax=Streptomyces aidingensis TaxID=910347 RepID=A0A1I1J3T7_9ACTN|nr:terpene synthase family protein [Streptomyces aidingensis]SFC40613.1 hypothetical protein SAMN05421773_103207 [Streptomyces aidingensis]
MRTAPTTPTAPETRTAPAGSAAVAPGWTPPPFWCPIEPADPPVHPDAPGIERRAREWVINSGIVRDETALAWNLATRCTDVSCRVIPEGDAEKAFLFTIWNHWACALDDAVDDGPAATTTGAAVIDIAARVCRALELPGSGMLGPDHPFAPALQDLVHRTRAVLTPVQLHRVAHGLRDWLWGTAWLVSAQERGVLPAIGDYAAMRPSAIGTRFSLAWGELAPGIAVPAEELYSPPVQAVTDAAAFVFGCDNDLCSWGKDQGTERTYPSLLTILARDAGCSPEEAVPAAVALRDRVMTLYLRLRDRIARDAGPDLRRYLRVTDHYLVGCLHWMDAAPRFASPAGRHPLPVAGARLGITWRDTPADDTLEPPPGLEQVAWWWRQLDG